MDKKQELLALKQKLESRGDTPFVNSPKDIVFGDGNPNTELMFIGEAAGYWETVERKPFVGPAGKLLVKTLKETLGLDRDQVYISNIVKARPPNNRDPQPDEIEAFRPYLDKEIEIIQPKIIATLGRFSMAKFIPDVSISRVHGQPRFFEFSTINDKLTNYKPIIFPMYHPAAALRSGTVLNDFIQDFNKLKTLLSQKYETPITVVETLQKPAQTTLF
ncbi:hypothetical protein A3H89_02875 [Candidatus Amesbacteria bacterium RIFCSPLOWO2_02_FULL_48_11]|uniref:Type-4 uracil-DNA glycosylase n=4 Tax=Candidatus Amesiibacteriota TaxID=1752730 RepID=A0A1F4ZCX0_9BACT|nr:MAG: hypothetical protein UX78_C0004G0002 [Candidatus Amesbacteria bacterium GW2011_GWA2_47_11]KKW01067.1 MAG: hypothetical protein UY33_C0002G0057 [Candidatus Amesbacteria bacterium GW2011_GWA1_48_9]OGC89645.1 MAG: hypothetical protein A2V48_02940 [Candidatus Amesbacteria bacterium RBG_19FT_COMBO_48_16]OGC96955.1 MAG: hypothetical protein A3C34_03925 [Candidatus Amesbacteria bacterium RIFCSPHIGHO2_02_FULL_48_21]OGC97362.1 MAG: hypothetical protein A2W16_02995 [Candidatus Amesbacteria bacter